MSDYKISKQTPKKTPFQPRPYIMPYGFMQSPHSSYGQIHETNSMISQDDGVIYGTNISTKTAYSLIESFILHFQAINTVDGEQMTEKIYRTKLTDMETLQTDVFEVKASHLKEYNQELYYQFIYFPAEMISCFDIVLKDLYEKHFIEPETDHQTRSDKIKKKEDLMLGLNDLQDLTEVKKLCPKHINRLIAFRGIVIRTSQIHPEMKRAFFKCSDCKTQYFVDLENAKVQEPTECTHCKLKGTLQLMHNMCRFTDKQYVKFQQLPEYVAEGDTPMSMTVICYDSNVDKMRPGDRVQVVGIHRAQSIKVQKYQNSVKSVFNTYCDLISFKVIDDGKFKIDSSNKKLIFNDDQKMQFMKMAERENIKKDLIASFAPSIFGHDEIKKGILAQLFSGTKKDFSEGGRGRFRSDINICLVGDPSTAKSQLLQQVYKLAPRGIYTSGRGSSAVGLTANVRKDPQTRQFILESGALVLSDLGICCIDEFDKMDQSSRTILLEAMEQQTISIAKAGIVCQLNSRASILAAANPVNSKYDPKKSVVENINLPPTLLSRFDLIYIILDVANEISDKKLATHILNIYSSKPSRQNEKAVFSRDLLSKYISYARQYAHPIISQAAGRKLSEAYISMRKMGNNRKMVTATPRQLQSLIRISQSFAKMRLSREVNEDDVEQAVALISSAIQQSATDPTTGLIDMDIITTGKTTAIKQKLEKLLGNAMTMMKSNFNKYLKGVQASSFLEDYKLTFKGEEDISLVEVMEMLRKMQSNDILAIYGQNKNNPHFRLMKDISTM